MARLDERHGFVRAQCAACNNPDVWLTCNQCKKSDRFRADPGVPVACHCGATYDHATCTCGKRVPREQLMWVAFEDGPVALAEWEIDRARVAILGFGLLAVLGVAAVGVAILWSS